MDYTDLSQEDEDIRIYLLPFAELIINQHQNELILVQIIGLQDLAKLLKRHTKTHHLEKREEKQNAGGMSLRNMVFVLFNPLVNIPDKTIHRRTIQWRIPGYRRCPALGVW